MNCRCLLYQRDNICWHTGKKYSPRKRIPSKGQSDDYLPPIKAMKNRLIGFEEKKEKENAGE